MPSALGLEIFGVLGFALLGGTAAKLAKIPPLVGYIISGILFRLFFPQYFEGVGKIAQIGLVLLLFSIGLELSFSKLTRVIKIAVFGGLLQISLVTILSSLFMRFFGVNFVTSLVLSLGFSLSSTAIVVKTLIDSGEADTIHGEVMLGWLLVQDLAVIPMMIVIYALAGSSANPSLTIVFSLLKAVLAVAAVIVLGKYLVPKILHKISALNSRELLVLTAVGFAIGTASLTALLGVSPALGAFLAGIVISESQEKLAVFAETRPLRDLLVALFFVSLGFMAVPGDIVSNFGLILGITVFLLVLKATIVFFLSLFFGYHGKTAIATGIGLSQVGEFSFVLFSLAGSLNLISSQATSIGIATALLTLIIFPFIFRQVVPIWRKLKNLVSGNSTVEKFFLGFDRRNLSANVGFKDHIIICGFGRVGSWVGKALNSLKIPFVVVDYSQNVVNSLKQKGIDVVYGDPTEEDVLQSVGITEAKAIVIAIPDRVTQESIVTLVQTISPKVKVISRVHSDEEWNKLKILKVDKIVQPEFEAAVAIVRSMLFSMGRPKEEIAERIKNLRLSRAMS